MDEHSNRLIENTSSPARVDHEEHSDRNESFVVFSLARELYAIEVARVREVLDVAALTRVPGGRPGLIGLYNLRGQVVPVWDLRKQFGLVGGETPPGREESVLMVEPDAVQPGRIAGLLVDGVSDVLDLNPEEVQSAPSLGLGAGTAFVRGLIRREDRFLLVLDLDRIFRALTGGEERIDKDGP